MPLLVNIFNLQNYVNVSFHKHVCLIMHVSALFGAFGEGTASCRTVPTVGGHPSLCAHNERAKSQKNTLGLQDIRE